jgi:predicted RNase H-like nuclease (RuvC/YqgF family)
VSDSKKYVIVGLDPGTNFGIAAITLSGEIVCCKSAKNLSIEEILKEITSLGTPAIVCTDKATIPELVKNVASILNVPIFSPEKDFSFEEKSAVVKSFENLSGYSTQFDEHQIVALFAAIKAYKHFKNDFKLIDSLLDKLIMELNFNFRNLIKLDLINGIPPKRSLHNHIRRLLKGYIAESYSKDDGVFSKQVSSLNEELSRLRKRVKLLESLINKASSEKSNQKAIKVSETTFKFVYSNDKKENEIDASKLFDGEQNYFKVLILEKASAKNAKLLLSSVSDIKKNNLVVYMGRIEGDPSKIAKILNKFGIKYALLNDYKEEFSEVFSENGVSLFPSTNVALIERNGSYYLSKSKLLELQKLFPLKL